jgi:lambda repressor-like predicted transcriptional regulator
VWTPDEIMAGVEYLGLDLHALATSAGKSYTRHHMMRVIHRIQRIFPLEQILSDALGVPREEVFGLNARDTHRAVPKPSDDERLALLIQLRRKGITQQAAADRIQVDKSSVSLVINGKRHSPTIWAALQRLVEGGV